jgi:SAM-dependent methyltransferase
MSDVAYRLEDLGDHRVLTVDGRRYETRYSARVVQMLVERKGARRAPPYFAFKRMRGDHFLGPLFRWLRPARRERLSVLEVGCSFGHITEYLDEQPQVDTIHAFDTDPAFVAIVRAKVEELPLRRVREVVHLPGDATRRLPWGDEAFDLVLALGVVEHLPARHRRAQVDEYYRVLAPGGHLAILDTPNRSCSGCRLVGRGTTLGSDSRASSVRPRTRISSRTAPAGVTRPIASACRRRAGPPSRM